MMAGNLGAYQIMTTLAKRVGGPINLGGIIALIGGAGGGILAYGCRGKSSVLGIVLKANSVFPMIQRSCKKRHVLIAFTQIAR